LLGVDQGPQSNVHRVQRERSDKLE